MCDDHGIKANTGNQIHSSIFFFYFFLGCGFLPSCLHFVLQFYIEFYFRHVVGNASVLFKVLCFGDRDRIIGGKRQTTRDNNKINI
jgi:hypothetical protein